MGNLQKFEKREKPYKFVTLSFDDGVRQDIRFIELLDKYGLKCTFNVNSGYLGQVHDLLTPDFCISHSEVRPDELREVYKDHELAAHSTTHPRLDMLTEKELIVEMAGDCRTLEILSGQHIVGMAYPGGPFYTEETIKTILEHTPIRYARSTESTKGFEMPERLMEWQPTCHWEYDDIDDCIDRFEALDSDKDSLFYLWGHTYEFDIKEGSWERIEKILERLSKLKGVTYATNGEIAEYIMNNK